MNRSRIQFRSIRDVAAIALAAGVLLWTGTAGLRPGDRRNKADNIQGVYEVEFSVYGKGTGTASVTNTSVTISGTIVDAAGNSLDFGASDLTVNNYRFVGRGQIGGVGMEVSGRIDPPDATLKTQRIVGIFRDANGRVGRLVGSQKQQKKREHDD
jgi:hypothetical protein